MQARHIPKRHVTVHTGEKVLIRPLKVADAALYPDFLKDVTPEDLRLRFFAAMRTMAPELIDKLVNYDPSTAMAFIAIEESSGRMLGVVRLHNDDSGENGEFAILTRSHMKGHGLGWLMMKHMIACAKAAGLKSVRARCSPRIPPCCRCAASLAFTRPTTRTNAGSNSSNCR